MTLTRTLTLLFAGLSVVIASAAHAAGGHDHGKEKSHFEVIAPASVKDAWTLMTAKLAEADAANSSGNLAAVHEASEQMGAAIHTLQEKSDMVAADAKTKLASALKQLDKAVDEVHHGSEEKDGEAATAGIGKIKGLLPVVEGLYPAGALK
ncbi:MAG: hypothetical protein JNL45_06345 [Hyphomicrobium sp.]|jgi:hypothetical protein|nr:hypothetical protein [Hyphomicrobium sp.]